MGEHDPTVIADAEVSAKLALEKTIAAMLGGPESGVFVGRYRIVEQIGEGGMGVVYAGLDEELDRKVAIKLVREHLDPGSSGRARLRREAKSLAKLSHPNVVHVYEVGDHEGHLYIAMEFVSGTPLRAWQAGPDLGWRDVLSVYLAAGRGLAAAHEAGLVHRDFKPDNVLVGDDRRPRVLDFGIARRGDDTTQAERLVVSELKSIDAEAPYTITKAGTVVGTPAYMAPEQLAAGRADSRSDQFAFCVALFQALYGARPFGGDNIGELLAQIPLGPIVPPEAITLGIPTPIHRALLKGLNAEPEQRHASMGSLLAILEAGLAARQPRKRRAWPWFALGVVGVVAVAVTQTERPSTSEPTDWPAVQDARARIVARTDLPPPLSSPLGEDPFAVTVHRLPNGLTVYIAPRRDDPRIEVAIAIRMAEVDDAPDQAALARLAVYALDSGTARLGARDYEAEQPFLERRDALYAELSAAADQTQRRQLVGAISENYRASAHLTIPGERDAVLFEVGAEDLRFSQDEGAVFRANIPRSALDLLCQLEAERLRRPIFRGFVSNVAEIIAEIESGEDDAATYTDEVAQELSASIGNASTTQAMLSTLARMPLGETRDYVARKIVPNNTAIVLVGDIDSSTALPIVKRAFGDWAPRPLTNRSPVFKPVDGGRRSRRVIGGGPRVTLAWPLPLELREDRRALNVLADLLERALQPTVSRLHVQVHSRAITASAIPSEDTTPREIEAAVLEQLRVVAAAKVDASLVAEMQALHRLRAARLRTTPGGLAQFVATSYLQRRPWQAAFREIAAEPPSAAILSAAAGQLIEAGVVAVEASEGRAARPEIPDLDVAPFEAVPGGRSKFAAELLARPRSKLEPQFAIQGRHYDIREHGTGTLITSEVDVPLFRLTLVFPIGTLRDPRVCPAVRSRLHGLTLPGVEIIVDCLPQATRIQVEGIAEQAEAAFARVRQALVNPQLTPAALRAYVRDELDARRRDRADPLRMFLELERFTAWERPLVGRGSPPSDHDLQQLDAAKLWTSLRPLLRAGPDVLYAGPRAAEVTATFDGLLGTGPRPKPIAERARRLDAPRVFFMHQGGRTGAHVMVVFVSPEVRSPGNALPDLYWRYLYDLAGREIDAAGRLGLYGYAVRREPEIGEPVVGLGAAPPPEHAIDALQLLAELVRRQPTKTAFRAALAETQEYYRSMRRQPRDLPDRVLTWRLRGIQADPLIGRWGALSRLKFEAFEAYAKQAAATAPAFVVVADRDRLDPKRLQRLGSVEIVDLADVGRRRLFAYPSVVELD